MSKNQLVDIYDLDRETLYWNGNPTNLYGSGVRNLLVLEADINQFYTDYITTFAFLKSTLGVDLPISVASFIRYLSNEIISRGYPLIDITNSGEIEDGGLNLIINIGGNKVEVAINGI